MDLDLAHAAIRASDRAQKIHAADAARLTGGAVTSANQRDKMLEHILEAYGVGLPDMQISTLERRIDDPDLPIELRELLAVRLQASKTSVSKYKRVLNGVSRDGRLRGLLAFCGALRTGRWAGRLWQPQNLARPTIDNDEIERGIEALKADAEDLV
jgi:DNA polymerase